MEATKKQSAGPPQQVESNIESFGSLLIKFDTEYDGGIEMPSFFEFRFTRKDLPTIYFGMMILI